MKEYTLSSYEQALGIYDQNIDHINDSSSKGIDELTEMFNKTQIVVENDEFLSAAEKKRTLKKRQEWYERLKKEKERQLQSDLDAEVAKRERFIVQDGWLDYYCFTVLTEIIKQKEEKIWEVNQEIAEKQQELARLQAEITQNEQEVSGLKSDVDSIQTATMHEAFFEFDVMPKVKAIETALKNFVENHKNDYHFPENFVDRTIRCLTKECKKQQKFLNYEWWKLKLSFDTVENWTKWESSQLNGVVTSILEQCGFVVSKMRVKNVSLWSENSTPAMLTIRPRSTLISKWECVHSDKLYLRKKLLTLDKDDIQWRIDIFKRLSFSFANETAFIKQVETARWEWVDLIEDIDKWLQLFINKLGGIELRTSDDKKQYFKISLDCKQRNPRILMIMEPDGWMKILCVAPHIDYDNILRGQTTNYFQTWKWDWTKRWKQWRKTWRA